MIRRKCGWCKQWMHFKQGEHIKKFCSKQCLDMFLQKKFAKEDCGPKLPPLDVDRITDEGFTNLVAAIVQRASDDVTSFAPGTQLRVDAEKFFKSGFFAALTGLEGEPILRELEEEYNRKRNKKRGYSTRKVRCVETGVVFDSIKEAAEVYNLSQKMIYYTCRGESKTAADMHFEYVED